MKENPAETYLQTLQSAHSRGTMESLLNNVAEALSSDSDDLYSMDWACLNSSVVVHFLDSLLQLGRSPATINTYLSAIKGVAREAWRGKLITVVNYQAICEIRRIKAPRKVSGRALQLIELNAMIDSCIAEGHPLALRDAAMIALTYGAGLRRNEAVSLDLSDFRSDAAAIAVRGVKSKIRVNPLGARIAGIINAWLAERGNAEGPLFVRIYKGGKITNIRLTPQTVYDVISKRYKSAGLKRLTPHDLRKTYATNLLENGEDIILVQELMGHSSVATTRLYDQRKRDDKRTALKALPL